jgi:hypothetical protein
MGTHQPNPTNGESATAQAKAALDEFRRRAASRAGVFGHPGITLGPVPSFSSPFGHGAPPFLFPGQPAMGADPAQATAVGTSVFQSLGTLLRLSVDVLNSGLQGFLAGAGNRSSGGSCGCGCGCEESCCAAYAAPQGCGCGCGCNPSVRNCP